MYDLGNILKVTVCLGFMVGMSLLSNAQLVAPFVEMEVGENWNTPVQIEFDANGRAYVNERRGMVWIIDIEGHRLPQPLIDIREEVVLFGDHGMLAIALHPDFLNNGYIYLLYVVDRHHLLHYGTPDYDPELTIADQATIGRITRYTADPATNFTTIIPGSRHVILGKTASDGFPILMASHGVGSLVFGSDGTLLASCGDAGSYQSADFGSAPETYYAQALEDGIIRPKENIGSFRAQLVDCLNGKIIRIHPETGEGLPGNPFFDPSLPNSAKSRVWALGFRQPYRFIVRPGTGSHNPDDGDPGVLFVGDVGSGAWEELNIVTEPGMNFGWPVFEGYELHWPFSHADVLNADAPNPLAGDACEQQYFRFTDLVRQASIPEPLFFNHCDSSSLIPEEIPHFVHALPEMSWSNEKYNQPTRAMIARFTGEGNLDPISIEHSGSSVSGRNFEGASSIAGFFYSGDQFPGEYNGKFFICDFSGWIRVFDIDATHHITTVDTFHTDVEFVVDIALHPLDGTLYHINLNHTIHRVQYGGNVAPLATIMVDKTYGPAPLVVQFDASASSDANGDPLSYAWDFGDGMSSEEVSPVHTFAQGINTPASYTVILTVTDSAGASATDKVVVSPNNTPPSVQITNPPDSLLYPLSGTSHFPLEADVSDLESPSGELTYRWQWFLHHNDHYHPEFPVEERHVVASISPAGCNGETYYYRIRLDVLDAQGLKGSDEVFIYPNCAAPVADNFILNGEVFENGVDLTWTLAASGGGELTYEIQRGFRFEPLLTVGVSGPEALHFFDAEPPKGSLVYRIKAIRSDGLFDFSNTFHADFPPPPAFRIKPNPVKDILSIEMPRTSSRNLSFSVFDPSGKLVISDNWWHTQTISRFDAELDVSGLSQGVYFYIMRDGDQRFDGSFIKVR